MALSVVKQFLHGMLPFPGDAYAPPSPAPSDIPQSATVEFGKMWSGSTTAVWGFGNIPPKVFPGFDIQEISCGCYHTALLTSKSMKFDFCD